MTTKRTMYEDRVLRLVDLAEQTGLIEDAAFVGCQLNGPAVFFPEGCTFSNSTFDTPDADAIIWDVPEGAFKVGAILVRNCEFEKCRFSGLGIAAPPALAKQLREGLPQR